MREIEADGNAGQQVLALQVGQPVGLMALDPFELLFAQDLRDSGQTEIVATRRRRHRARVRFADRFELNYMLNARLDAAFSR